MLTKLAHAFDAWRSGQRTAAELARLSDSQLRDIGLTRGDIPTVVRGLRQA